MGTLVPITLWFYIIEFHDGEDVSAITGEAESFEECQACVQHDCDELRREGCSVLQVEACELCLECRGDGQIESATCMMCGGQTGSFESQFFLPRLGWKRLAVR